MPNTCLIVEKLHLKLSSNCRVRGSSNVPPTIEQSKNGALRIGLWVSNRLDYEPLGVGVIEKERNIIKISIY